MNQQRQQLPLHQMACTCPLPMAELDADRVEDQHQVDFRDRESYWLSPRSLEVVVVMEVAMEMAMETVVVKRVL